MHVKKLISRTTRQSLSVILLLLYCNSCNNAAETDSDQNTSFINGSEARSTVEALGRRFSEAFLNKDSLALAKFYASDGMLGTVKGHDNLVSAFDRMIRNASENGTPGLLFATTSVTTDDEYIIELGNAQWADSNGSVKRDGGKYLVVWKQEGNGWKIYRDWGL